MYQCLLCKFEVQADDALFPTEAGKCICLRCYHQETDSSKNMSLEERKQVVDALRDTEELPS